MEFQISALDDGGDDDGVSAHVPDLAFGARGAVHLDTAVT